MDLIFLFLLALVLPLSVVLVLLLPKSHGQNRKNNLPPGKTGWPLLGETPEFISRCQSGIPEKFFQDRMSQHSPNIFRTSLLGEEMAVLCGADGHRFLFSNENKLVSSWWPASIDKVFPPFEPKSSLEQAPDTRLITRKTLTGFLRVEALKNYIGVMDAVAKKHVETHWDSRQQVTVYPLAKSFTFEVACQLFMSLDDNKMAKIYEPFEVLILGLLSVPIDLPGTPLNRAIKASEKVREQLIQVVAERKAEMSSSSPARNDMLNHMLTTTIDSNGRLMSETEIANTILSLLVGGYHTASSVITFIIKYLAEMPHIYDAVYKEQIEIAKSMKPEQPLKWEHLQKMTYTWNVARETMRVYPPGSGTFREAIADFNYAGFSIPKGFKLHWSTYTTHKDPQYFVEPEKFDPSRFEGNGPIPYTYVPFGGGPRMCPGMEYARFETLVYMHYVVTRFKWEKVFPDEKIKILPSPHLVQGLPIRLLPL